MELETALAAGRDETGPPQPREMRGARLPRHAQLVPGRQPAADLEQGLPGPVGQLVEDRPARGIGEGLEDVSHAGDHRQVSACLSSAATGKEAGASVAPANGRGTARELPLNAPRAAWWRPARCLPIVSRCAPCLPAGRDTTTSEE